MRVALIARSTLFTAKGGDTIQVEKTAKYMNCLGVQADIKLTHEKIDYSAYDLLHFFNLIRPGDILPHIRANAKPFVVTPIMVNYSEYDKGYRKGIAGRLFKMLSENQIEYLKAVGRLVKGQEKIRNYSYFINGHKKSINNVLRKASWLLPNSQLEYSQLVNNYSALPGYSIIPNGVDEEIFIQKKDVEKDNLMILSVARIEGIKNQLNLIKAINNSKYKLYIIGSPAVNQSKYYKQCRALAGANIHFVDYLQQNELIQYYRKAKVHVLPSWFETCGLSTLEAGAMLCNVVISDKGFVYEYFNDHAFYCDPASPSSILEAIDKASASNYSKAFQQKIFKDYTWNAAAMKTFNAYQKLIPGK
ncbi:MAG: glycosyltransferase family 4 protein [Ginsengibacter sp.]